MRLDRAKFMYQVSRRDLTLTEVAKRAGVARATVSYAKNGKSCTEDTVNKLAAALKVEPEAILEEREEF